MNEMYLKHHGIKGQKWGDRNGPPYPLDGSQASAAERKKGFKASRPNHAQRVANRLYEISNNDTRKALMTSRQKQSFKRAQDYWYKRAAGASNAELRRAGEGRGLIRRMYDVDRSYSLDKRIARNAAFGAATGAAQTAAAIAMLKKADKFSGGMLGNFGLSEVVDHPAKMIGKNAVQTGMRQVASMPIQEVTNLLFGHF